MTGALATLLLIQLPVNAFLETADNSLSAGALLPIQGGLDSVSGSWLQPVSDVAEVGTWGVNQHMEGFSFFLSLLFCLSNK